MFPDHPGPQDQYRGGHDGPSRPPQQTMKTWLKLKPNLTRAGSILVVTLLLGAILVLTLGGYLWWVRTQNLLVAESQAWNSALALAEGGIEEAMAQINIVLGTNFVSSVQTNGWGTANGGGYGPRTNILAGGYYSVIISNDSPPTLYSTGYAQAP